MNWIGSRIVVINTYAKIKQNLKANHLCLTQQKHQRCRLVTRCNSLDTEWQQPASLQAKTGSTASDTPLAAARLSVNKTQAPIQWFWECLTWVAGILQQPLWSRSQNTSCEGAFPTCGCETWTPSLAYVIILTYIINAWGGHLPKVSFGPLAIIYVYIFQTRKHYCYKKPDERLLERDVLFFFFNGKVQEKKNILKSYKIVTYFCAN